MPFMSSVNTVTGDANFSMEKTALTVGGFTQPSVARNLWDQQASIEKGLPQRFLWLIPQPYFSTFDSLEPIDEAFYDSLGVLISVFVTQPLCNSYITSPRDVSGVTLSAMHPLVIVI